MKGPPPNVRRAELRLFLHRDGVSPVVVANMVEDVMDDPALTSAAACGLHVRLTWHHKRTLGIKTIACIDRNREWVAAWYREQKRERDRNRWRRKMEERPNGISPRARELATELNGQWIPSRDLVERVKAKKVFRSNRRALEQAVLRASQELCEIGVAEQKIDINPRMGGRTRFLRWNPNSEFRREDFQ
jgi:hypothetical protein